MTYVDDAIKGVFLLILAIAGNFVAETLGCKTQNLLSNNMIAKHFIIVLILYFSINFTSEKIKKPIDTFKLAVIVYCLFILFTKMSLPFTILVFMMLIATYVITNYIDYYKTHEPKHKNIKYLEKTKNILQITMIGVVLLGFSLYFKKQYTDHQKNWSTIKYIFGVSKCASAR